MARYVSAPGRFEKVIINNRSLFVCSNCRYPMIMGHTTIYEVPVPGKGLPGPSDYEQALCNKCRLEQHKRVYPKDEQPVLVNPLFDAMYNEAPVEYGEYNVTRPPTDLELFEQAINISKASGGAESPDMVLKRLRGNVSAETTVV